MFVLLWMFVQVIAESLPISSSGHVTLLHQLLDMHCDSTVTMLIQFLLHVPALLILLIYFFKSWWNLVFASKSITHVFKVTLFVVVADLVTILFWYIDLAHVPIIEQCFLPVGFCLTMVCLYITRYYNQNKILQWSVHDGMILGIVQGLSLLPGISRFASTYSAGLLLGYSRWHSFCISFLIQIPLLCAAILKSFLVLYHHPDYVYNFLNVTMIFSLVLATLFSYIIFSGVGILIEKNKIWYFSLYMIIPISLSLWLCKG
ncbi:undecaprenyl-diphosphate phosphatase [Candidatus Babeliales bacterium]|nr:undecaprenyl-diphosphate phosphatase [Candidatus Babeliales bacterium]